jgi:iron(III) transport system ATP-binding protein
MYLSIEGVSKKFGQATALERVDLALAQDEFTCLLGPSGCGKTTLLRIVAGLEMADTGRILLDGHDLSRVPARDRGFGIVFQSYSLFPNMNVAQNVAYGLSVRGSDAGTREARVNELLDLLMIPEHAHKLPHQLSGGQQQRVAIARALAVNPRLLLLDEPLSALDARVRSNLRDQIRDLQRQLKIPTLMVTHDQEEAMAMADRIVCMRAGQIEQAGTPDELYLSPRTSFVASFIGEMNFISGTDARSLPGPALQDARGHSGAATMGIRPESIVLHRKGLSAAAPAGNCYPGRVRRAVFLGPTTRLQVETGALRLTVDEPGRSALAAEEDVLVEIPPHALVALQ